jgi:hypothetical protein
MIDAYYVGRGLDEAGLPSARTEADLGLELFPRGVG